MMSIIPTTTSFTITFFLLLLLLVVVVGRGPKATSRTTTTTRLHHRHPAFITSSTTTKQRQQEVMMPLLRRRPSLLLPPFSSRRSSGFTHTIPYCPIMATSSSSSSSSHEQQHKEEETKKKNPAITSNNKAKKKKKVIIKNPWKLHDAELLHRSYQRKYVLDDAFDNNNPKNSPYDYIIIGSGIGGLWLAACLAKFNYTSLVLEQHYTAGGLQHEFTLTGKAGKYEFVPGLHYIANLDLVKPLYEMVATPTEPPLRFMRAGNCTPADHGMCCSHDLQVGDLPELHVREGIDTCRKELVSVFPNEQHAIDEFLSKMEKAKWQAGLFATLKICPAWLQWILSQLLCSSYIDTASQSTLDILKPLTKDGRLHTALSLFAGDLGENLADGSFAMQAAVMGHVLEGCYYPEAGPQQLVRGLIPTIRNVGGDVLVKAPVQRILIEKDKEGGSRAVGVQLLGRCKESNDDIDDKGDCIYAKRGVVSDAGIVNTLEHLVPPHFVHPKDNDAGGNNPILRKLYDEVKAAETGAVSHCFGFVGLNASAEELHLRSSSYYYLPWNTTNADSMDATAIQEYYRDTLLDPNVMDLSAGWVFVTAKDPYYSNITMPGKSTVVIFSEARIEDFAVFLNDTAPLGRTKRTAEYEAAKDLVGRKMMRGLLKCFPHLEPHIDVVDIATPLTMLDYTHRMVTLGLRHNPRRMTSQLIRPACAVEGLYFTGQDVAFAGWAGALTGAMVTAQLLLGYKPIDFVRGKTLLRDLGQSDLENEVREKMNKSSKTKPLEVAAEIFGNAVRNIRQKLE